MIVYTQQICNISAYNIHVCETIVNYGQLIFNYVFSKTFHYYHRCNQQTYISLEVITRPFSKKYKMSNKDQDKDFFHLK